VVVSGVAIRYYWGLVHLLALSGIDINDVYDMLSALLTGERPMWFIPATDDATGIKASVLMGRTDDGRPLVVLARVDGRDLYVVDAFEPTPELIADFEEWEARND
jgi:hypothetical protein